MHFFIEPFRIGFLVLTLTTIVFVNCENLDEICQGYCYSLDNVRPQTDFFSSKTSYFIKKRQEVGKQFRVPSK